MKRILLAVLVASAITAACQAQTIAGPDTVAPGKPVWFSIVDLPTHAKAAWLPSDEIQAGPPYIQAGHALFFATASGTRTLSAMVAIVDADGRLEALVPIAKKVQVGEPTPEPPPNPPVPPTPTGPRQLILIWESGEPTEATATAAKSKDLKQYLVDHNHHLWMIDKDAVGPDGKSAPAEFAGWLERAKKETLPRLFIVAASSDGGGGNIVWEGSPPATAAEWLDLIKRHGG